MMRTHLLVIESSTADGSVAVIRGDEVASSVRFSARDSATGARTEALGPAVAQGIRDAGVSPAQLSGIVCDSGPGGFTSLRCAAAIAKGMCSTLSLPLFAISSLDLLAWSVPLAPGSYVAALGAGRSEWFTSLVEVRGAREISVAPYTLSGEGEMSSLVALHGARTLGPGLDIDTPPLATAFARLMPSVDAMVPVDLDAWEPQYGRLAEAQVRWEAAHGRPLVG